MMDCRSISQINTILAYVVVAFILLVVAYA